MKITSAIANKMLRQLNDDKEYWTNMENTSCIYTATLGETPVVPEYDYTDVANKIAEIDDKIATIKHAINLANVNSQVTVGDKVMSVDTILVAMAQLNKRKNILDFMRKQQPQQRLKPMSYSSRAAQPEYQYINYDLDLIKSEFERISLEIMDMQVALDKYNQTEEFEVEV